jgi:hypothetical protein
MDPGVLLTSTKVQVLKNTNNTPKTYTIPKSLFQTSWWGRGKEKGAGGRDGPNNVYTYE